MSNTILNKMNALTILALTVGAFVFLSGCLGNDNNDGDPTIRLAFSLKDDYDNPDSNPQRLADWIASETGRKVELYPISSEGAAIEALRFGHADAAFLDGGAAWQGWVRYDLQVLVADQKSDGRTHYNAQAWVHKNSSINSFDDLEGMDACHTGWLKSAGMLMPMGYLIGNNHTPVVGNSEDITSLRDTIDGYFGNATIPESGSPFYSYKGAFRCLTEGEGDVAFVKDTTWQDYCEGEEAQSWCLARDDYRTLPAFGAVPSHPVMVNPDRTDAETLRLLKEALLSLNDSPEGKVILENVLETPGITEVDTDAHLGSYGNTIQHVPGIAAYFNEKFELSN